MAHNDSLGTFAAFAGRSGLRYLTTVPLALAAWLFPLLPLASEGQETPQGAMHFVLVSKSHFDIGYSALARDVEHEYRTTMIDRALETMEQNAKTAGPGEQFVWTIPGWPMQTILWDGQNPVRKRRIEQALQAGNLVIHALPYTLETGSADVETLARCFIYSSRIARKYGLPLPNDAKMTDVPGHDWIIPTLLHHAGVKFFHLGANPTNIQAKQPRIFWWEGPDGSRVLTLFSNGYDSGLLPPKDWPHRTWLALVMSGDNEGPPSATVVRGWIDTIRKNYPNAKITVGRLEDFANSLLAEKPDLPVVRGSVSDSWIHGLASSPNAMKTLAQIRPKLFALESLRTLDVAWGVQFNHLSQLLAQGYENSLRWSEHTWGLANQHFVPGLHGRAFFQAYAAGLPPNYQHMVESWKEHDKFASRAEDSVVPALEAELHTLAENVAVSGLRVVVFNPLPWPRDGAVDFAFPFMGSIAGKSAAKGVDEGDIQALQTWGSDSHRNGRFVARNVPPLGYKTYVITDDKPKATSLHSDTTAQSIENRWFKVTLDSTRGCIVSILEKSTGAELVDKNSPHGFGQYLYQQFDRGECDAYINSYILPAYRGSHGRITGKSTYVPETAKHLEFSPREMNLELAQTGFSITATLTPPMPACETAHTAGLRVTLYEDQPSLDLQINIINHPATENPEAGWLCLPLAITEPRYLLRTPGAITDPAKDMIEGGNFAFFWTQGGLSVCDPAGHGIGMCSPDAPAVSLSEPGSYKFRGEWNKPKSSIYVHLFNNQWNTNFRSFWSGEFSARVRLWPITRFDPEKDLVTPSEETLAPMLTGLSNYKAGSLPSTAKGIQISRKGLTLTALGPNPDGPGTLLRLWELAGKASACTLVLPPEMKVRTVQPVDLRGRPTGDPILVEKGSVTTSIQAFAPHSFLLSSGD
jgi:alpha-mannosidase